MPEASAGFLRNNHFLWRRLHSLTGVFPVGVFLINHLLTNSTAFLKPVHFDEHVQWLNSLPWLLSIEFVGIFLPLAYHAAYGVVIALQGRPNARHYPYMDNWRYTLQRVTAWITLVFILVHLGHFRFAHWFGGVDYKEVSPDFFAHTQAGFLDVWVPLWVLMTLYLVGLAAAVFHLANGLVTFCITWGITVGDAARRKVGVAAGALGVLLFVWGVLSLVALTRPVDAATRPGSAHPAAAHAQAAP